MESKEKSKDSLDTKWNLLSKQIHHLLNEKLYYKLLAPINLLIDQIDVGYSEITQSDLKLLISACKHLDTAANEHHYRIFLHTTVFTKLMNTLTKQNKTKLCKYTRTLIFENGLSDDGSSHTELSALNDLKLLGFQKLYPTNNENPYDKMQKIHKDDIRSLRKNPSTYTDIAIMYPILRYWRALKVSDEKTFSESDITPLLELGESLLQALLKKNQPSITIEKIKRMCLLLQALLYEHPKLKDLQSDMWPLGGFAHSLIAMENFQIATFRKNTSSNENFKFEPPSYLLSDHKMFLDKSRTIFDKANNLDICIAQSAHSSSVIDLLRGIFLASANVLGNPPCKVALCLMGSSSRFDRRPHSDVELVLLHSEPDKDIKADSLVKWRQQVDVYMYHLFGILELLIERIGESHIISKTSQKNYNAGFHVDTSSHVLDFKLWGTPSEIARRFILDQKVLNNEHPWICSQSLYSLLSPLMLHPGELGGDDLIQEYETIVDDYLRSPLVTKRKLRSEDKIKPIAELDRTDVLKAQFNLPSKAKAFNGLYRYQAVAVTCLYDVFSKSHRIFEELPNPSEKNTTHLNLKDVFYKPLAYWALNMRLYYNLSEKSPAEILLKFTKSKDWKVSLFSTIWLEALKYISRKQVDLHMESDYQEENLIYPPNDEKSKVFWAGLDLIYRGLIKPFYEALQDWLITRDRDLLQLTDTVLMTYLNERKHWFDDWEEKSIDPNQLLNHEMIEQMCEYPDSTGWSPSMENAFRAHLSGLQTLAKKQKSNCQVFGIPSDIDSMLYLPDEIVSDCFDRKGTFVGDEKYSRQGSQIKKVKWEGNEWYIKVKEGNKEELLRREFLAMMTHLNMGGKPYIALGWPLVLRFVKNGYNKAYYVWISESKPGDSMGFVMNEAPDRLSSERIDALNYGSLFFWNFVTCQEDGQPENFKIPKTNNKKTNVYSIDYGQCLVQATKQKKGLNSNRQKILVQKTMINCLPSIDETVPVQLYSKLALIDPKAWVDSLQQAVEKISDIFKDSIGEDLVTVPDTLFQCMGFRLNFLQPCLPGPNNSATFNEVLNKADPLAAILYESLRPNIKTPDDFYKMVDSKAYIKDKRSRKMVSSASFRSIQAQTLTVSRLQQHMKVEPEYFKGIKFKKLSDEQQLFLLDLLDKTSRESPKRFNYLNLSGCLLVDDKRLIELLKPMYKLEVLDISNCPQLSVGTILHILSYKVVTTSQTKVILPNLRRIYFTLDGKSEIFLLPEGIVERQKLQSLARNLLASLKRVHRGLLKATSNSDTKIQVAAFKALGKLGLWSQKTKKLLLDAMHSEGDDIRNSAVVAAGNIGQWDNDIGEALSNGLAHEKESTRLRCRNAIKSCAQEKTVIEQLSPYLYDEDPQLRLEVVNAFIVMNTWNKKLLRMFVRLRDDEDNIVRFAANQGLVLADYWDNEVHLFLINCLNDMDEQVIVWACSRLGYYLTGTYTHWDSKARNKVLELFSEGKSGLVRHHALKTLLRHYLKDKPLQGILLAILRKIFEESPEKTHLGVLQEIKHTNCLDDKLQTAIFDSYQIFTDRVKISVLNLIDEKGKYNEKFKGVLLESIHSDNQDLQLLCCCILGQYASSDKDIMNCLTECMKEDKEEITQRAALIAYIKCLNENDSHNSEIDTLLGESSSEDSLIPDIFSEIKEGDKGLCLVSSEIMRQSDILKLNQSDRYKYLHQIQFQIINENIFKTLQVIIVKRVKLIFWNEKINEKFINTLSSSNNYNITMACSIALSKFGYADPRICNTLNSIFWFGGDMSENSLNLLSQCFQQSSCLKYLRHQIKKLRKAPTEFYKISDKSSGQLNNNNVVTVDEKSQSQLEGIKND